MNPLYRWLVLWATCGLLLVRAEASLAGEDVPLLWTGTIQSAAGAGAPAEVTAYLHPPASRVGDDDIRLQAIAATTADPDGRFALRAPYDDAARAAADPAGWISVLVVAMTSDGMSMATDSVRFDQAHRRWSTRPAEAEAASAFKGQSADPGSAVPERPAVMRLHRAAVEPEPKFHAAGTPTRVCWMKKGGREAGVTQVTVGELDLAEKWGGEFSYTDTRTSTVEVGFKFDGEGMWSAGGSSSFSKEGSSQSINPVEPAGFPRHNFYRADMVFRTVRMKCGDRMAEELRPTMWTGGMHPEMASAALCDHRYTIAVPSGATFARQEGSSQSFSGAFSIVGFSGGASSVNSNAVRHAWLNKDPHTRNVCGVSDFPTRDSRVVSLP